MKRLQAFKFQLRPGGQQECEMRRFAGACRFVFNRALARQNENHEAGNKYIPLDLPLYFQTPVIT
ncbi:helix-turn-helix domain-containing protein [Escherichia coli]|nr:helix-turn-helix domain-containing protein [Escherichia coli]